MICLQVIKEVKIKKNLVKGAKKNVDNWKEYESGYGKKKN